MNGMAFALTGVPPLMASDEVEDRTGEAEVAEVGWVEMEVNGRLLNASSHLQRQRAAREIQRSTQG